MGVAREHGVKDLWQETTLTQCDDGVIPDRPHETRLFSVVRNEELRLPYFLRYYAGRGVDRFFFVDNDSSDGTLDILLGQSNVHVFKAAGSFAKGLFGSTWIQRLLGAYGREQWSVVADADELLLYPGWEHLSIPQFCRFLSSENANAFRCILVDMYSDRSFAETNYAAGADLLTVCPYFESDSILCVTRLAALQTTLTNGEWNYVGGMRYRLFNLPVLLDKVALIRFAPSMRLQPGQHALSSATFSALRGAMLHFKFLSDFHTRAVAESARGEHWKGAEEYKRYAAVLEDHSNLRAFWAHSLRLSSPNDLISCGIMNQTESYQKYVQTLLSSEQARDSSLCGPTVAVPFCAISKAIGQK